MVLFARRNPGFSITHDSTPGDSLVCGFTGYGLAGLTAVDFLVDHLDLEETGHLTVEDVPSITPFVDGTPNHHTRFFSRDDLDVTVMASELSVPPGLGRAFGDAILDWTEDRRVDDVAVLSGVPIQHGPDEHRTFYVATEDYQRDHLQGTDIPPMGRGFVDGVNGALVERGISSPLGVCVYLTPVHAQVPDAEAAVRLVETVETVYDLGIDPGPLVAFAEEIQRYYTDLAERMQAEEAREERVTDRMYM